MPSGALGDKAASRATLQALAEVKTPRTPTFVRQVNAAQQQVVNNNIAAGPARTEETAAAPNGLLEVQHGNFMATCAAGAAGRADSHLEAVDARDRADPA